MNDFFNLQFVTHWLQSKRALLYVRYKPQMFKRSKEFLQTTSCKNLEPVAKSHGRSIYYQQLQEKIWHDEKMSSIKPMLLRLSKYKYKYKLYTIPSFGVLSNTVR